MDNTKKEKDIRLVFVVSLILKGLNAFLEIIGGILLFFTGTVTTLLSLLINGELVEDPHDFIASHLQNLLPYFSGHSQLFFAFYLLIHGVIKIFLVVNLLRNKIWAYPTTIVVLGLFILYQLYRLSHGYSWFLVLLTVFDMLIIYLTWHEYKLVKKHVVPKL